jgi:hypothetical protein
MTIKNIIVNNTQTLNETITQLMNENITEIIRIIPQEQEHIFTIETGE